MTANADYFSSLTYIVKAFVAWVAGLNSSHNFPVYYYARQSTNHPLNRGLGDRFPHFRKLQVQVQV